MKFYYTLLVFLLLFNSNAQEIKLTKGQMLEDFDKAVSYINTFAVHKDLNAARFGIDYEKEYKKLRNEINNDISICEFRDIFERTISLVQDQHCSSMPYNYFEEYGEYQKKFNFNNDEDYKSVKFFEEHCKSGVKELLLPIIYYQGEYVVYANFEYNTTKILQGTILTHYNGKPISDFIKENFDKVWPVKWDERKKIIYNERFYQYGDTSFNLTLKGTNQDIQFSLLDTITFDKKPLRKISYYSQEKEQVMHFKESNTLYIGMPFMDAAKGESIVSEMKEIFNENGDFSKVIIDIRGNPGGNDECWQNIVSNLISEPIDVAVNLKFKHNNDVLNYYNEGNDKPQENIQLLNNSKYWTQANMTFTLEPNDTSIKHKGKIYVIQDNYIYSSAANLSRLCDSSEQLISIGNTTDLVGGLQTEPLFFKLENSGLIFRIEPMLDFSGVNTLNDFSHNKVEVKINPTPEDYLLRTTYKGNIYSKDFLIKHDKLFKYVIADK